MLGIALSAIVYLRSVSVPEYNVLNTNEAHQYLPDGIADEDATVLNLSGSIFFGSTAALERTFSDLADQDQRKGALIIDGEYIDNLDEAGSNALITEANKRHQAGGDMYLWLRNHRLDSMIDDSGLRKTLGSDHVFYVKTADESGTVSEPVVNPS
jgi:MFS superfamily sulfate permease-like transporter